MARKKQTPQEVLKLDERMVAKLDTTQLIREVDKRVRKVFTLMTSDSEVVRTAADKAMREYADGQRQLFASKGLLPDRASTEAMVPYLDGDRTRYRLVKRGEPLVIEINPNDGSSRSVSGSKLYSDRVGRVREERRGKYNDAGLLIMQSAISVDRSEMSNWTRM